LAIHRFYIAENIGIGQMYNLSDAQAKHAMQVLRLNKGQIIELTNGNGVLANASIVEASKKNCAVVINSLETKNTEKFNIHIAISPTKNNARLEWFLEKATEVGVAEITPLICNRTEKQNLKTERLEQIIISALLQSKNLFLPKLNPTITFNNFLQQTQLPNSNYLIAHCLPQNKNNISQYKHNNTVILIGPEGDFSPEEIDQALQNKYQAVAIGNSRLRTETAGLAAAIALII
jgi:16S rRNA (uracil1498-N3)-methyltransferase